MGMGGGGQNASCGSRVAVKRQQESKVKWSDPGHISEVELTDF